MVAAITGILMGIGTLLTYGTYNIINSLTGNNSSAVNTTQVTVIHSNQSNNTTDGKPIPLNVSTNIEKILEFIEIENTSLKENILPMSTQQKAKKKVTLSKINTQYESNSNDSHKSIEKNESDNLMGRELDYEPESYTNEINKISDEILKVQNLASASDVRYNTNDPVYQEQELDYTESPERLNPKLTLNINSNKNKLKKTEETKMMFDFEPFPSLKRKLDNEINIDVIPDNPLYELEHEVQVKNPLYPIDKKKENQHQEKTLHLNEIASQSYEKINPKLILNFNKNINSKEEESMDTEINYVENHNLESNVHIPEAKSLINEDLAAEVFNPAIVNLIDSLVSKKDTENLESEILLEEEVVIKSFLGDNEVSSEDMNVKTLFTSYAEIAGIVVASVLIVTGLIFLSIRQAMKHRRQTKIQKRYAENETGRVNTLTHTYTNDVE